MPKLAAALLAGPLVAFLAIPNAYAQTADGRYLIVSSKESKCQEDLDRAAAAGYRVVNGDAGVQVALMERTTDGSRRSYAFATNVERFINEQKLQQGFRLVPSTFAADEFRFAAVFEKVEGDEQRREYSFVKAGSTGGLRKRLEEGAGAGLALVAVAAGEPGAAAIYERGPQARKTMLIDSGKTGTLQQELQAAADNGYCAMDSAGSKEAVYAMEECPEGGSRRSYEVIATTKIETFEKELNAGAARGLRLLPATVLGVQKRLLMRAYNYETIAVLETVADRSPITYRVLGTMRLSTLDKELKAAADDGFA